ncbi:MAG: metallophosphoesterase [Myxococcaceae bacterium]
MTSRSATKDHDSQARLAQTPVLLFIQGISMALVALGVLGGLHYYVGARLIGDVGLPGPLAVALWVLLFLFFLAIPFGLIASRSLPRRTAGVAQWISFLWMGAFGLLLTTVAASDVVVWVVRLGGASSGAQRLFWGQAQAGVVVSLVAPALVVGFVTARGRPVVERLRVGIRNLGAGFEGLRIVQLTDLHISDTLDGRWLERVVEQTNSLDPDLIVITGDLVDGPVRRLKGEVASIARLKARRGVFFVTGNHEYYAGAGGWVAELTRLGVTVLLNEHRVLEAGADKLVLAGVTDHDAGRFGAAHASRPDLAFAGAPEGTPRLLLAHQPRSARAAAPYAVDLQLSGHTHGGQMFPWMFFVRLQQPVIRGLTTLWGVPVYTSRGTGYWGPPIRLGPKPEITEVTLTRG